MLINMICLFCELYDWAIICDWGRKMTVQVGKAIENMRSLALHVDCAKNKDTGWIPAEVLHSILDCPVYKIV